MVQNNPIQPQGTLGPTPTGPEGSGPDTQVRARQQGPGEPGVYETLWRALDALYPNLPKDSYLRLKMLMQLTLNPDLATKLLYEYQNPSHARQKGAAEPFDVEMGRVQMMADADMDISHAIGRQFQVSLYEAGRSVGIPQDPNEALPFIRALDAQKFHEKKYTMRYQFDKESYSEFDGQSFRLHASPAAKPDDMLAQGQLMLEHMKQAGHDTVYFNGPCTPAFAKALMQASMTRNDIKLDLNSLAGTGLSPEQIKQIQLEIAGQHQQQASQNQGGLSPDNPNNDVDSTPKPSRWQRFKNAFKSNKKPDNTTAKAKQNQNNGQKKQVKTGTQKQAAASSPKKEKSQFFANFLRLVTAAAATGILAIMMFGSSLTDLIPGMKKDKANTNKSGLIENVMKAAETPLLKPGEAADSLKKAVDHVKDFGHTKHKVSKPKVAKVADNHFEHASNDQAPVTIIHIHPPSGPEPEGEAAMFQRRQMGQEKGVMSWNNAVRYHSEKMEKDQSLTQKADGPNEYTAKQVRKMRMSAFRAEKRKMLKNGVSRKEIREMRREIRHSL